MTWQVRQIWPNKENDLMDLGDWEPFGVEPETGAILVKKQTIIEDEKSSVEHELSFAQRHPDSRDFPED
jgi:hypothetical protein